MKRFLGDCIGVELIPRGSTDNHILFKLLVEDDENWFDSGFSVSSSWIDETMEVLRMAKMYMEERCEPDIAKDASGFPPNTQFGWKFKK